MERWDMKKRHEVAMVDLEALVPKDHLLRKVERVMDYEWIYTRLEPFYCADNGRPNTDPVMLIKMVLIQHLFGLPSLRRTHAEIQLHLAYRWFLGLGFYDDVPHFATVSYAFCKRFPPELAEEIFAHILNKAINNRMVDTKTIFVDGTHIKANANKKKFQKEQVEKASRIYAGQLREEVNAEREALGKKPVGENEDDDNDDAAPPTVEKTVSTTDPESGMFVKGEHERQFAYEAHTACDKNGFVVGVEVTAGNVHDSVAFDALYDQITAKYDITFMAMDAGYKIPWICKKTLDTDIIPIMPYTRPRGNKDQWKPWDYEYDPKCDTFACKFGGILRHTTTDKEGKRTYRTNPKHYAGCGFKHLCGANEKGQKVFHRHIWQDYSDIVEALRKTELGQEIYSQRKQTIERVFADAKEKHAMRYTYHRGLARVSSWVRLKFAAMNLKKLANWSWKKLHFMIDFRTFTTFIWRNPIFSPRKARVI